MFLSNDGSVFGLGGGSTYSYALGNQDPYKEPTLINSSFGINEKIVNIAAGEYSSFVITDQGTAFGTGSNMGGRLGIGDTDDTCRWFRKIKIDASIKIVNIIAGDGGNTVFQSDSGQVFLNDRGWPTLVKFFEDKKVLHVFAGRYNTFFVCDDHKLYGSGSNHDGKLGIIDLSQKSFLTPTEITAFKPKKIIKVIPGQHETHFLSDDGTLYGIGLNDCGALGFGDKSQRTAITEVSFFANKPVSDVIYSGTCRIFITQEREVFVSGCDGIVGSRMFGLNKGFRSSLPMPVPSFRFPKLSKTLETQPIAIEASALVVPKYSIVRGNGTCHSIY